MTEPEDQRTVPARGRGRLRASHADREQAIEVLKDAFAQGRLDKDELDVRAGQAFASRTYAELAAVTADLPAAPAAAAPAAAEQVAATPVAAERISTPARTLAKAALRAALCVLVAAALVVSALLTRNLLLVFFGTFAVPAAAIAASGFLGYGVIDAWQERRSRAQLRSGPGQPGGGLRNERSSPARRGQSPPSTSPDLALPGRTRADRTRTELRTHRSRWGRPRSFRRGAPAPRGIRPVPDAV
jgi:Domain of unknown function (DUF1707)